MTDQELLQQAKDHVAIKSSAHERIPFKGWDDMIVKIETDWANLSLGRFRYILELSDAAALLAIQSAREEGAKEERSKQPWKGSMYQDKN